MPSRPTWLAVGVCAFLTLAATTGKASTRYVKGIVETADGKPVPHVEVRVINVGGTISSDSAEFDIPLSSQLEPGDPIIFQVKDWVIVDPYVGESGRTYVPRNDVEPIKIAVARKGDQSLLSNQQLIQQIVQGVTSRIVPKPVLSAEFDHFLADQATELGFTVEQLESAITAWSKNVQEPYQKGLAALYVRQYRQAGAYIQQSISSSENNLVSKYISLAAAENGQGHYPAAESALRKACALRGDNPLALRGLGQVLDAEAKYSEAEPLDQRALAIDEKALGPEHPEVARDFNNLATLYLDQGKYAKAEPLYRQALAIDEKALGAEHPSVAAALNNLALLYGHEGKYAKAESLYQRALAIDEKALGAEHPSVATDLNNLALLYDHQGRYAKAEPLYRQALAINEKALGPEHPSVATDLNNLATLYLEQGKYAKAEPLDKRALAIDEKALGPEHPEVARDFNNLAGLYYDQGKYAKAEPLYRQALAIDEKALGLEHPDVARNLNNLALLYYHEGKYAKAEPLFKQALAIDEKALGPEHPDVAMMAENLAGVLRKLGRESEAKVYEEQAARIRAKMN